METNQGLTLDRYLREKGALAPDQAAKIAIQVAQQMGPAAGPLLIHPGRILVTREGSVRLLPPPAEELALPAIVEFPAYASPEEIHGGDPDIRSGLYSLGSTLFELISGHPPYQRKDPKELLRAHLEDPVPDLKELSTAVKPALAEVVRELLEKDPELRIQSAGELVRRLKQALHGGGAATNSRTNSGPPSRAPRKGDPAAAASAPRKTAPQSPRPSPPSPPSQATPSSSPQSVPPPLPERRPAVGARARTQSHLKTSGSLHRGSHGHGHGPDHSHSHGPTRARQGRHPTGSTSLEEMEEAEGWEESQRRRSVPYFSIAGAVLGAFFGLLWILHARQEVEDRIHADAQKEEQKIADTIAARKKKFLDGLEDTRKNAEQSFSKAMKVPEEKKREQLILCISNYLDSPSIKPMAEALLKTPAFVAEAPKPEDVAKREAAYQKQKDEALKLYGEGKIGDAIAKIMENSQDYKKEHDAELTELVEKKWSAEIDSRWKATKELAERLGKDAEGEKAIEEFRKAMVYGDGPIRKECQEKIDHIQQLLAIRAKGDSVKLPKDQLKDDEPKEAEEGDPKKGDSSGAGSGKKEKKPEKKAGE